MKLTFLGATHEVTGSCTLITVGNSHVLVDCGMEQGEDIFENRDLSVEPSEIDCLLLTHAHIDHSGKIPLLCKNGFKGKIYMTEATARLALIMLRDSAHIQMFEAEWKNRKNKRSGLEAIEPLYDLDDVEAAAGLFIPCKYNHSYRILENVYIRFNDVGHLLGSSSIEVTCVEGENGSSAVSKTVVFSGDVGNTNQPILKDPRFVRAADYLVIESTYGDRLHPERPDYIADLTEHIQKTLDRGGNVVIPSFAVGRTQELLYFIREIKTRSLIKGHDNFPVYVDSPLAIEATSVFLQCDTECFDKETVALIQNGINPIYFDDLRFSVTSDDSKAINLSDEPKVIISASGMCEAGRIRHHLKHNLWRKESLIIFFGYQAEGTLGRALVEGADRVKLFGEEITVNAEIAFLNGVSGHADRDGLLRWVQGFSEKKPAHIFVNHGDDHACAAFTELLSDNGFEASAPYSGSVYDIAAGKYEIQTDAEYVEKYAGKRSRRRSAQSKDYSRLLNIIEKLVRNVGLISEIPNRDIKKFASQLEAINYKWENWFKNS